MLDLDNPAVTAADVCRGVGRLFWRRGGAVLTEFTLATGRRLDLLVLGADGCIDAVEVKVSLADLRGDAKWPEYLPYCDRFWWAVPPALVDEVQAARYAPDLAGIIVADRFGAAELAVPGHRPLAPARRKALTLAAARAAALRLHHDRDPSLADPAAM